MTAAKRLMNILVSLAMLLFAGLMLLFPEDGYEAVILLLDISLLFYGLRMLFYYLTMARFMVGGIATFYKSIIAIDFGLFVFHLEQMPQKFAMLYLLAVLAFSGVVDILRAMESRRIAASWRLNFGFGLVKVLIALACLFFLNSVRLVTIIYAVGLVHSAIFSLIHALRKTAIVHVGS